MFTLFSLFVSRCAFIATLITTLCFTNAHTRSEYRTHIQFTLFVCVFVTETKL